MLAQPGLHEILSQLTKIAMVITKSPKSSLSLFCMFLLRRDRCLLQMKTREVYVHHSSHSSSEATASPRPVQVPLGGGHARARVFSCKWAVAPQRLSKVALIFCL